MKHTITIDGKRISAKRVAKLLAIAAAMKKEARVRRHIIGDGYHLGGATIEAPEGRTVEELYILAHECGHAAFRHDKGGPRNDLSESKTPRWQAEFEAELWALAAFRRHGVVVSKTRIKNAKANVRLELSVAWNFPLKQTAIRAAKWCGLGGGYIAHRFGPVHGPETTPTREKL